MTKDNAARKRRQNARKARSLAAHQALFEILEVLPTLRRDALLPILDVTRMSQDQPLDHRRAKRLSNAHILAYRQREIPRRAEDWCRVLDIEEYRITAERVVEIVRGRSF